MSDGWDVVSEYADTVSAMVETENELRAEIAEKAELLQRVLLALDFWLPKVPENGPQEIADRIAADAELLVHRDGDMIEDAEERGWITLQVHPRADGA